MRKGLLRVIRSVPIKDPRCCNCIILTQTPQKLPSPPPISLSVIFPPPSPLFSCSRLRRETYALLVAFHREMYFSMQAVRQVWSLEENVEPGGEEIHFSKQFELIFCWGLVSCAGFGQCKNQGALEWYGLEQN
ncbi:hypothetical protein CIHG_10598 [Coccidioides immitis H538.4]|uniref:Uncharacterized protein n=1 Tax=Coccidioides immitis H538.4 TaxID=396776 RepID=A0A0N8FLL9_COCIT|nr:hypothetical protein CIHG_10598 [Coccidioides immitis H538.4]